MEQEQRPDGPPAMGDEAEVDAAVAHAVLPAYDRWTTTWGTTLIDFGPFDWLYFDKATVRQVVHTSTGGVAVRIRFSNAFGTEPLEISAAHIALSASGSSIVADSDRKLTFEGAGGVAIPAGEERHSDPIAFDVPARSDLAISIDLPRPIVAKSAHNFAMQTLYVADQSGVAGATDFAVARTYSSWAFLEAVDVATETTNGAIVAFGDSLTDGYGSTENANRRWPDGLARRLSTAGLPFAVVSEAYSGNQLLAAGEGQAALVRFERDVLANAGVTHVILLEGINDIGFWNVDAGALIAGYRQLIDTAHSRGLAIFVGTLCPFKGATYYSEQGEATRIAVNRWIRDSDEHDGVIDFDRALRDPRAPWRLWPAYDSGDGIHPNDAGYEAMAGAVDLAHFE